MVIIEICKRRGAVTSNRYKMYMATIQPTYSLRALITIVHDHHQSLLLSMQNDNSKNDKDDTAISSFPPDYVRCPSPTALQYLYTLSIKAEQKYGRSGTIHAGGTYIYHDQIQQQQIQHTKEVEILEQQKLHYEKRKKELKIDFQKSSREVNRLCSLNVKALLQNDPQWNLFWQTLLLDEQITTAVVNATTIQPSNINV